MTFDVSNIQFSYGRKKILNNISFSVPSHTILSVLGCNGAGKSTLLKCMTNGLKACSGKISLNNEDILSLKGTMIAKKIGYVPQSVPPSSMSVFDAVLMGRKPHMKRGSASIDKEKTARIIDEMGLSSLALNFVDKISGGEFQKVNIARAVTQEPNVLILDEPCNNLDVTSQHKTMHLIKSLVKSNRMSAIMSMHDINLAIQYSDLFLFLEDGKVLCYGDKEIITESLVKRVYGFDADIIFHKNLPLVVPKYQKSFSAVL